MQTINRSKNFRTLRYYVGAVTVAAFVLSSQVAAQPPSSTVPNETPSSSREVLTRQQRKQVDHAVDRGLAWMAGNQNPDGSFPTHETAQPAVTSLCLLAMLSAGHLPGQGPYGDQIEKGIDYVLSCQRSDGLLNRLNPGREYVTYLPSHTAAYNHPISGLLLTEAFGMSSADRQQAMKRSIMAALQYTLALQHMPKKEEDRGGWRYIRSVGFDSALSTTSWQLMFLRSAKNAGFEVPGEVIDDALAYVERLFDHERGVFAYRMEYLREGGPYARSMAAEGILALHLGGKHETPIARAAGEWILRHDFDAYNRGMNPSDRYHYGAFYCSIAMFQLGGRYWERFYPRLVDTLLANQSPAGSWQTEAVPGGVERRYGSVYSSALTVLALTTPYQLLPIFQR